MHVLIINGSPRVKKYSNTDTILEMFTKGLCENGTTFEQYEVSDVKQWEKIREAYYNNSKIIIALPLYVECIPGLLLEFLETLEPKNDGTGMAFILQSGFAEGIQLRCGETYLEILTARLGCEYLGTLVKGDNFAIRFFEGEQRNKITEPYTEMGREYSKNGDFRSEACRKFTGPEVFSAPIRFILGLVQKTLAKKMVKKIAENWGCTKAIDYRPYS